MEDAMLVFKDKKRWMKLVERTMQYNFSWKESAKKYLRLYERAKEE
jgi:starch synthase